MFTQVRSRESSQYVALAVISLITAGATLTLGPTHGCFFRAYFGSGDPLLVVTLVIVLGFVSLRFLRSHHWFEICTSGDTPRGVVLSVLLATFFAIEVIIADYCVRFPQSMNVPPPWSLAFYPAIAHVVEVVFHTVPLALLLVLLSPLFAQQTAGLVWCCLLVVSMLEPLFQVWSGLSQHPASWADGYVGLHVWAFNLVQLYLFLRFGFVSMYSMRVVYYFYWHVIWGYARLQLLF